MQDLPDAKNRFDSLAKNAGRSGAAWGVVIGTEGRPLQSGAGGTD